MFLRRRSASIVRLAVRPVIEGLEQRQMMSASVNAHGILNVNGTGHADTISVEMDPEIPTNLDVSVNGNTQSFVAAYVKAIKITTGGGGDYATVDSDVTIPATIVGGAGNDTLMAGGGTDSLHAGSGNDSLTGGTGTDTLVAGGGNDTVVCGNGADRVKVGKGQDSVQFAPESGVPVGTVPLSVQSGISTLAQGADVTTVEPFVDNKHTYYGADVDIDGQFTRLVVDAAGDPVGQAPPIHAVSSGPITTTGGPIQNDGIFGSVVSTDAAADTITVTAGNPWGAAKTVTFSLTSATALTADGATVTLADLIAGTLVCIQTSIAAATTATSITAIDPHTTGEVTAIDTTADTITISNFSGTKAYAFNSDTAVTTFALGDVASTISAVKVGDQIELTLPALGGDVLGIVDGEPGGFRGSNPTTIQNQPGGKVVSVDSTDATQTITLVNGDGIQTTYTLNSAVTVTLDGATSTLSAIAAGDFALLQLSTITTYPTVMGIAATDQIPPAGTGGTTNPTGPRILFGSIIGTLVSSDTITFESVGSGIEATYTLAPSATVNLDGVGSTLSAIAVGDNAEVTLSADGTAIESINASDKTTPPIFLIPQFPPATPTGIVISTTADTISIYPQPQAEATFTLAPSATVTLDGVASTLSALVANDTAILYMTPGTNTVASIAASDQPMPPRVVTGVVSPVFTPGATTSNGPVGVVVSVDTTAGTITLQVAGSSTPVTLTVLSDAVVTLDGEPSMLSAIVAGDNVSTGVISQTMNVTSLNAVTG